jgi:hypothetical protein
MAEDAVVASLAQHAADPADISKDAESAALLAKDGTMQAGLRKLRAQLQEKHKQIKIQGQASAAHPSWRALGILSLRLLTQGER